MTDTFDAIDAALCDRFGWRPLDPAFKQRIRDSIDGRQPDPALCARIGRLLRTSPAWRELLGDNAAQTPHRAGRAA